MNEDSDPGPISVGASIREICDRVGIPLGDTMLAILDSWPEIIGARLADLARPVALTREYLIVETEPAAASLVKAKEPQIVKAAALKGASIRGVRAVSVESEDTPR